MPDVPLSCRCGEFKAHLVDITPGSSNRVSCYCDDCQTFAHLCGAEDILDEWGGTDINQVSPTTFVIDQGAEHLEVLRLSPKSDTYRWKTTCCDTPIGNTTSKIPFIGVIHTAIADKDAQDAAFGPACRTFQTKFATGDHQRLAKQDTLPGTARVLGLMASWWIRGHKRKHPLFPGGRPMVDGRTISKEQRQELLKKCGPEPELA